MAHNEDFAATRIAARRAEIFQRSWIRQPSAIPVIATCLTGASVVVGIITHHFLNNNSIQVNKNSPRQYFNRDSPYLIGRDTLRANSIYDAHLDRATGTPKNPHA